MKKGTVGKILYIVAMCVVILLAGTGCGSEKDNVQSEDDKVHENAAVEEDIVEDIGKEDELQGAEREDMTQDNQPLEEEMLSEADQNKEKAEGKKLSIFGDSISTYDGWIQEGYNCYYPMNGEVLNVNQTWWKMLLDDMGMEFCANGSSSGSTCAGDSLSPDSPQYGCDDYRIGGLVGGGIYPDIIIVYMGTNDLLNSIPIGENDGTQIVEEGIVETFSDAYCLMLDKMQAQYPGAQIFCCSLPPIGDWGISQPLVDFVNDYELTSEDYSRQIEIIASSKGFPVIDLWHCGITIDNMSQYTSDSVVHPNPEGMKLICDAAKAAITSFYQ